MNYSEEKRFYTDCHSHLLPGLDDGAFSEEETRELLEQAWSEGIHTIAVTPHFRPRFWRVLKEEYNEAFAAAEKIAQEIAPDLKLAAWNELYCDKGFIHSLIEGECRSLKPGYVLVEFDYECDMDWILSCLHILQSYDFIPVLAHAERYTCLRKRGAAGLLSDKGMMLQVNTDSVTGENGLGTKFFVRKLLKEQLVDFLGTDCHHPVKRPCRYQKCAEYIKKACPKQYADALLYDNPGELTAAFIKERYE